MKHAAQVLSIDTPASFQAAVEKSAALLRAGQLVAMPTETVYGLAANALDARAVAGIFEAKGRPSRNPIIVHVDSVAMARRCTSLWTELAGKLAAAFWPGPLTLVLPRSSEIPEVVTASGPTVGIRWPMHPFIQAVISACGFPLAAPSANPSNQISPTRADHVLRSLGDSVPLIVDGGPSQVGIESSVIDISTDPPRLLRPGMIHTESLVAVTGQLDQGTQAGTLRSPGLLPKHYSPRAKLMIWHWQDDQELRGRLARLRCPARQIHVIAHSRIPSAEVAGRVSIIPHDAEAFARAIYAELHHCDAEGAQLIVVEQLPDEPAWHGIADRLRRACA